MRRALLAIAMFGMAASAEAADMPDFLRGSVGGPAAPVNWSGFYAGGQGAWSYSNQTFDGSTSDGGVLPRLISGNVLSEISGMTAPVPFGTTWRGSPGYGAFVGYNWQWDDVVAGAEMSYLHGNFGGSVSAARQFSSAALSDGLFHDPLVTSTLTMSITDYATFRARAGYAYGCFLPYVFGGVAVGYGSTSSAVRVDDFTSATATGPFSPGATLTGSSSGQNHVMYGYSGGLGVDVNLTGGLFMRAEWEYVRFTQQVDMGMNTVRAGLGYKF